MKITRSLGSHSFLSQVRFKQESADSLQKDSSQSFEGQESSKDPLFKDNEDQDPVYTTDEVGEAVQEFCSEELVSSNHLQVSTEGVGSGLRVVLKDPQGMLLCSFSGQEFIELRKICSSEGRKTGKILDQKR